MQTILKPMTSADLDAQAHTERRRRQGRDYFTRISAHAILLLLAVMALVPVLWMISSSLKAPTEIFVTPINWIPATPR